MQEVRMKDRDDKTVIWRVDMRGNQAQVEDGESSVLGRESREFLEY